MHVAIHDVCGGLSQQLWVAVAACIGDVVPQRVNRDGCLQSCYSRRPGMQLVSSGNESALLSAQQGSELCELHDG